PDGGVWGPPLKGDCSPAPIPDGLAATPARALTSPPLKDGINYYLHLRTVDQAGNWSPGGVHLGPFFIDGTPPLNGVLAATPGSAKVSLTWSRFSDRTSGLSTANPYRLVYSTSASPATRGSNSKPSLVGAAGPLEHQELVPG